VSSSSRSAFVKTPVVALVMAALYRCWLVTPVLKYLSIGKWYVVAIVVAAASGCVTSLLRLPTLALVCASLAGLLLGGTCAEWQTRTDLPMSVNDAFRLYLESCWRQLMIMSSTVTVGGICCARFLRDRPRS
jgi:hypothetical protein